MNLIHFPSTFCCYWLIAVTSLLLLGRWFLSLLLLGRFGFCRCCYWAVLVFVVVAIGPFSFLLLLLLAFDASLVALKLRIVLNVVCVFFFY